MKRSIFFVLLMFFLGCAQQTKKDSRQFDKEFRPEVLLKDGENIKLTIRCWYKFRSETEEPFNELGYFIEEDSNIHPITQAIVYASVREVFKTYTSKELYEKESHSLKEEIYQVAKRTASSLENPLKILFNEFLLGDIEYPHIVEKAKMVNLLTEFDALKSRDSNERMQTIQKLLNEGSKESYAIVFEHWASEKNEAIREYILESVSGEN